MHIVIIHKNLISLTLIFLFSVSVFSQDAIKKVIVETYYISDANDATDTIGGYLEPGSITYRIYVQMKPGCSILKIYGDNNHDLKFSSTANFFNNLDRGKTFAKDINKSNYNSNTVALDTWLTLGETTKKSINTYFGILKAQDNDGSFIGGINNDGGSAGITNGLLINNDALAGIPLTTSDGMDTLANVPTNWSDYGFIDLISGVDSTIFGSAKIGNSFISKDAYILNSGIMGVIPDSNQVLIAQLTTKGKISFELNLEVKEVNGAITKYVANGKDTLNEKVCSYLKYPIECGCKDPNYLEFRDSYLCNNSDSCKTLVVLGCMDPKACNYNSNANYNIQSLCCYPGLCADRDISLVCPTLGEIANKILLYPNPVNSQLSIQLFSNDNNETRFVVFNSFGKVEFENSLNVVSGTNTRELQLSNLSSGLYLIRFYIGNEIICKTFMKN